MDIIGTVLAIILIVAILTGAVYFLWRTRNLNKPSYMIDAKAPKMTKEEKAAAKEAKKAEKGEKKSKGKSKEK